ncbi:Quinone oxidoreductase [Strongyloides ratti]|uniref:Quinone oxidoreductase n=1 Tax=Strongyloides ratti TaxID=34506 RepID=A0A090LDI3_STRRB|nr:Quinone oxidoreductase [Strongyloides ratti]CEF67822.1 Quinone oxidoreductase [Strongyloides ratti]
MIQKMKAAVVYAFGPSKNIKILNDYVKPTILDHECLINVKFAGVNPVDTYIREGKYPVLPELPYIPGREGSGIVVQIGPAFKGQISIGDRVWFSSPRTGSCAEFCAAKHVFPLPKEAPLEYGAVLGIAYSSAFRALFMKANITESDTLLIHGASGGVGTAAIQLAKSVGAKVIGTAGSVEGMELIKKHGCDEVYNHRTPEYINQLKETYPQGFSIILEVLANVNLDKDLDLVGKKGKIVIIGNRGMAQIDARKLMAKESMITGVGLAHTTPQEFPVIGSTLSTLLNQKKIFPIIQKIGKLEDLSQLHDEIMDPNVTRTGKITVSI